MATDKLPAIERLFFTTAGWCADSKTLNCPVITSAHIVDAIKHSNANSETTLSDKNPANFLKDIVRNGGASSNWPKAITTLRFTARQVSGNKNVFVFLPFGPDQTDPFPDPYVPNAATPRIPIQSLSLSLEAKELGRIDEAWLLQTAINLRVVETHFALSSKISVLQIVHLQMSVKLANTEIDALFYAKCRDKNGRDFFAIITCEAKQKRERILDMQICEQVIAVFKQKKLNLGGMPVTHVIPIALRVISDAADKGIYVAEFPMVSHNQLAPYSLNKDNQLRGLAHMSQIPLASDGLYRFYPDVKGIG